jgi:CHAT domain-containing protein
MMEDFYTALMAGQPKIVALQQTQQRVITGNSQQLTGHPFYWAPFFLVGDAGQA